MAVIIVLDNVLELIIAEVQVPSLVKAVKTGVHARNSRWRGYRATYSELSRTVLAPRQEP